MSMRDRPRLSDRIRGKSGNDLMNEFKKEFEDNKKAWFTDRPSTHFSNLRREGFPFENDDVFAKKSDPGIKSHLEDLAKKHPEFANDLRCPPWGGSLNDHWDKAFNVPISVDKHANTSSNHEEGKQNQPNHSASQQESNQPVKDENSSEPALSEDGLKQHGLRNTVDIVDLQKEQKLNEEQKRASSAPPDTAPVGDHSNMSKPEQKRFTSKIEITPVNPYEQNSTDTQSASGDPGSSNTANAGINCNMSSNVREIPIQTVNSDNLGSPRMGRSRTSSGAREIPIHTDRMQTQSSYGSPSTNRKQPQVRQIPIFVEGRDNPVIAKDVEEPIERGKQFQQEQAPPLKRKLDSNGSRASTPPQSSNGQSQHKQQPPHEKEIPVEKPSPAPHPPPPPPKPKEPLDRIQEVKEEVESLSNRVQQYNGKSRTEKEYLYLDEMLTRNLIKLDTIEVEGNDKLRNARKEVIRSIQKSIALLESKVPIPEAQGTDESPSESVEGNQNKPSMDVDNSQTKENANEEKKDG